MALGKNSEMALGRVSGSSGRSSSHNRFRGIPRAAQHREQGVSETFGGENIQIEVYGVIAKTQPTGNGEYYFIHIGIRG